MALSGSRTKALILGLTLGVVAAQVIELDDSFLEKKGEFAWLIEFYAPWCGHCRRLEPIYHQVWLDLRDSPVRVAKVDATRHSAINSEYDVRGFPTIKFVQGDRVYTHRGDRSREGIVEFAKRAFGPQVRRLRNVGKFVDAKSEHSDGVFFVFVGPDDESGELFKKYQAVAEQYAVLGYYYAAEPKIIPESVQYKYDQTVLVFKDGKYFEYDPPRGESTKTNLEKWINGERYTAFPKIAGGALNEMAEMPKKLVIIVTNETDRKSSRTERFKEVGRMLATQRRDEYHSNFQFMWMDESETMNSITMMTLETPCVLVLDPVTQYYYLPHFENKEFMQNTLEEFLQDVVDEKSPAYGGTGFFQRLKRLVYDIVTTVWSLYESAGWIAVMVLSVPCIVFSIVCYVCCCMEPFDDSIFERGFIDEADDPTKKRLMEGDEGKNLLEDNEPCEDDDGHLKRE